MPIRLPALLLALATAAPISAQSKPRPRTPSPPPPPKISIRPYFLAAVQNFSATETFNAIFGSSTGAFYGGGVQVALRNGLFVDLTASRFNKTGQRAFRFNNQNYEMGIPLTATVTPFEVTGGYRYRYSRRVIPYVGAGIGSYGYTETSEASDPSENVDVRHAGYLVAGGVEFRLHKWVGATADVQYTSISGILGSGGISKEAGESNLGGTAARFRVIVGR